MSVEGASLVRHISGEEPAKIGGEASKPISQGEPSKWPATIRSSW
jgi:hypothetical protein